MAEKFAMPIVVRFRDIDAMGHVNNAVFLTYFEEARKAFFFKILKTSDLTAFPFVLAHISCDYIRPVRLNTPLSLSLWVKEIGKKSFQLGYRLTDPLDESIVYAAGESVQVCFDYRLGRSMEVPAELKQKLLEYQ